MPEYNKEDESGIIFNGFNLNIKDKWKLVSHLHKSIRHGDEKSASEAAEAMYVLDKNYARYRLAVIAFEDVAGGSPDLINKIMQQGWSNADMKNNGGADWFKKQAVLMAGAVKNRFANDLCNCAYFISEYLEKFSLVKLSDQTIENAKLIAWNCNENYYIRALAAWRIVGTKAVPNKLIEKFEGSWNDWIESCRENGIDEVIIECMNFGMKTQNEGSHIFLPFTEVEKKKSSMIVENNYINLENVGPYCSSSIDKHTAEGKRAIKQFIENNKELKLYAKKINLSDDNLFILTGKIQFREEGGVLNRSVFFPEMKNIEKIYWKKFAEKAGFDHKIYSLIKNSAAEWQKARINCVFLRKVKD